MSQQGDEPPIIGLKRLAIEGVIEDTPVKVKDLKALRYSIGILKILTGFESGIDENVANSIIGKVRDNLMEEPEEEELKEVNQVIHEFTWELGNKKMELKSASYKLKSRLDYIFKTKNERFKFRMQLVRLCYEGAHEKEVDPETTKTLNRIVDMMEIPAKDARRILMDLKKLNNKF